MSGEHPIVGQCFKHKAEGYHLCKREYDKYVAEHSDKKEAFDRLDTKDAGVTFTWKDFSARGGAAGDRKYQYCVRYAVAGFWGSWSSAQLRWSARNRWQNEDSIAKNVADKQNQYDTQRGRMKFMVPVRAAEKARYAWISVRAFQVEPEPSARYPYELGDWGSPTKVCVAATKRNFQAVDITVNSMNRNMTLLFFVGFNALAMISIMAGSRLAAIGGGAWRGVLLFATLCADFVFMFVFTCVKWLQMMAGSGTLEDEEHGDDDENERAGVLKHFQAQVDAARVQRDRNPLRVDEYFLPASNAVLVISFCFFWMQITAISFVPDLVRINWGITIFGEIWAWVGRVFMFTLFDMSWLDFYFPEFDVYSYQFIIAVVIAVSFPAATSAYHSFFKTFKDKQASMTKHNRAQQDASDDLEDASKNTAAAAKKVADKKKEIDAVTNEAADVGLILGDADLQASATRDAINTIELDQADSLRVRENDTMKALRNMAKSRQSLFTTYELFCDITERSASKLLATAQQDLQRKSTAADEQSAIEETSWRNVSRCQERLESTVESFVQRRLQGANNKVKLYSEQLRIARRRKELLELQRAGLVKAQDLLVTVQAKIDAHQTVMRAIADGDSDLVRRLFQQLTNPQRRANRLESYTITAKKIAGVGTRMYYGPNHEIPSYNTSQGKAVLQRLKLEEGDTAEGVARRTHPTRQDFVQVFEEIRDPVLMDGEDDSIQNVYSAVDALDVHLKAASAAMEKFRNEHGDCQKTPGVTIGYNSATWVTHNGVLYSKIDVQPLGGDAEKLQALLLDDQGAQDMWRVLLFGRVVKDDYHSWFKHKGDYEVEKVTWAQDEGIYVTFATVPAAWITPHVTAQAGVLPPWRDYADGNIFVYCSSHVQRQSERVWFRSLGLWSTEYTFTVTTPHPFDENTPDFAWIADAKVDRHTNKQTGGYFRDRAEPDNRLRFDNVSFYGSASKAIVMGDKDEMYIPKVGSDRYPVESNVQWMFSGLWDLWSQRSRRVEQEYKEINDDVLDRFKARESRAKDDLDEIKHQYYGFYKDKAGYTGDADKEPITRLKDGAAKPRTGLGVYNFDSMDGRTKLEGEPGVSVLLTDSKSGLHALWALYKDAHEQTGVKQLEEQDQDLATKQLEADVEKLRISLHDKRQRWLNAYNQGKCKDESSNEVVQCYLDESVLRRTKQTGEVLDEVLNNATEKDKKATHVPLVRKVTDDDKHLPHADRKKMRRKYYYDCWKANCTTKSEYVEAKASHFSRLVHVEPGRPASVLTTAQFAKMGHNVRPEEATQCATKAMQLCDTCFNQLSSDPTSGFARNDNALSAVYLLKELQDHISTQFDTVMPNGRDEAQSKAEQGLTKCQSQADDQWEKLVDQLAILRAWLREKNRCKEEATSLAQQKDKLEGEKTELENTMKKLQSTEGTMQTAWHERLIHLEQEEICFSGWHRIVAPFSLLGLICLYPSAMLTRPLFQALDTGLNVKFNYSKASDSRLATACARAPD
eukprot:g589.t1